MVSQPGHPSSETARPRPACFIGRGWPPVEFRRAHNRVLARLEEARAAGDEDAARRLEEEAEVLRWKKLKMMMPDREVPAAILEKFDKYEDHPPMPASRRPFLQPDLG